MNTRILCSLVAAALSGAAQADFTGPTAPGSFAVVNVGNLQGNGPVQGTALFSNSQLQIAGADTQDGAGCSGGVYSVIGPCEIRVSINLGGTYSFDWSYFTADADGPGGDMFGVIVDGTRTTISDLGGAVSQLGQSSYVALSSFAWFLNCTDCTGGRATVTISSFNLSPVPEPAAAALWLAGLAAAAGAVRLRRR